MALTKDQKHQIVSDTAGLLETSKLTVVARYPGTTVEAIQELRRQAKDSETNVRVIKNRLVAKALQQNAVFKDIDTSLLTGQLLYAFNAKDEVAPAQVLAAFIKTNPTLDFIGAITGNGEFVSADDVKALANLPSKDQLRAQLVGTIGASLSGFLSVLSGNLRGVINVLHAHAAQTEA